MKPTVIPIPLGPFRFVNAFLICAERTILVDTGLPGSAETILGAMKQHNVDPKAISLILITHAHIDHMGSACDLRERIGVPVAVHESEVRAVRTGIPPELNPINFWGRLMRGSIERRTTRGLEPDIAIIRGMGLAEFGIEGKVIETPGHTAGSVSVLLPGVGVIAGDLLSGHFLHREKPMQPPFQEDLGQVRESIKKVLQHQPATIYVGHGGPLSPSAVRSFLKTDRAFASLPASR